MESCDSRRNSRLLQPSSVLVAQPSLLEGILQLTGGERAVRAGQTPEVGLSLSAGEDSMGEEWGQGSAFALATLFPKVQVVFSLCCPASPSIHRVHFLPTVLDQPGNPSFVSAYRRSLRKRGIWNDWRLFHCVCWNCHYHVPIPTLVISFDHHGQRRFDIHALRKDVFFEVRGS